MEVSNFEIAGADKVFHPAKALIINRKQIKVFCPELYVFAPALKPKNTFEWIY
jgi:hypothetical protein